MTATATIKTGRKLPPGAVVFISPAPRPARAEPPPPSTPLLDLVRQAMLDLVRQGATLRPPAKAGLMATLRACGKEVQRAIAILSQGASSWACPSCGPLLNEPIHGADEVMHCPNDGCDAVVQVAGIDRAGPETGAQAEPKGIGHAYRGKAGTAVPPGARA